MYKYPISIFQALSVKQIIELFDKEILFSVIQSTSWANPFFTSFMSWKIFVHKKNVPMSENGSALIVQESRDTEKRCTTFKQCFHWITKTSKTEETTWLLIIGSMRGNQWSAFCLFDSLKYRYPSPLNLCSAADEVFLDRWIISKLTIIHFRHY